MSLDLGGSYLRGAIVAGSCHLFLHACNRSLFARGLLIDSRAYVISQHVRWPIRTPRPTCVNQDTWVVITPKRPKVNSIHTAAWHAWTRTSPCIIVQKTVFCLIHFPASLTRLKPSCHFDLVVIKTWLVVVVGFTPNKLQGNHVEHAFCGLYD